MHYNALREDNIIFSFANDIHIIGLTSFANNIHIIGLTFVIPIIFDHFVFQLVFVGLMIQLVIF
jgi:hypothetical protein